MIGKDTFQRRALELARADGRQLGARLAEELGLSGAAASTRLRRMVKAGLLKVEGATRARVHRLAPLEEKRAAYRIEGLSEELVWRELCAPTLRELAENVRDIWHYGVTEMVNNAIGTWVFMELENDSPRRLSEVFEQFAAPEEYTFSKTIVPVRLAIHEGEKLVSRSQAKRITFRFEKFRNVILDFDGVEEIGQAFADEIFRVFQGRHPEISMVPVKMNRKVEGMIRRALARGG